MYEYFETFIYDIFTTTIVTRAAQHRGWENIIYLYIKKRELFNILFSTLYVHII